MEKENQKKKEKKVSAEKLKKEERKNFEHLLKANNRKKDKTQTLVIILLVLLALEIVLIPCLVYAEVRRLLPVIAFLILPTVFGIVVILLIHNCTNDYEHKKERLKKKL